jgi:hypothetical protein
MDDQIASRLSRQRPRSFDSLGLGAESPHPPLIVAQDDPPLSGRDYVKAVAIRHDLPQNGMEPGSTGLFRDSGHSAHLCTSV